MSLGDQQINSLFVGAVWGTGLDMKDVCDRAVVQRRERTVREAMESAEIRRSAQALASATDFERLVELMRELATGSGVNHSTSVVVQEKRRRHNSSQAIFLLFLLLLVDQLFSPWQ